MQGKCDTSMMGELIYFLGLQLKKEKEGIYLNQAKYTKDLLKRFKMDQAKEINTPISTSSKLDKDENGKDVDQRLYRGYMVKETTQPNQSRD